MEMTQKLLVEKYMTLMGHITAYEAFQKLNIIDLASIIRESKNDGKTIYSAYFQNVKTKRIYKAYAFKKSGIKNYKGGKAI